MAYLLSSTTIRRPFEITESNSTQIAQNRTLDGSITRDFFGSNKRIWTLNYKNTNINDFNIIDAIYTTYLASGTAVSFESTESNYTISAVNVHVDLQERNFNVRGSSYISDFSLILIEA